MFSNTFNGNFKYFNQTRYWFIYLTPSIIYLSLNHEISFKRIVVTTVDIALTKRELLSFCMGHK